MPLLPNRVILSADILFLWDYLRRQALACSKGGMRRNTFGDNLLVRKLDGDWVPKHWAKPMIIYPLPNLAVKLIQGYESP